MNQFASKMYTLCATHIRGGSIDDYLLEKVDEYTFPKIRRTYSNMLMILEYEFE